MLVLRERILWHDFEKVEGPFWLHVHDRWEKFPYDAKVKLSLFKKSSKTWLVLTTQQENMFVPPRVHVTPVNSVFFQQPDSTSQNFRERWLIAFQSSRRSLPETQSVHVCKSPRPLPTPRRLRPQREAVSSAKMLVGRVAVTPPVRVRTKIFQGSILNEEVEETQGLKNKLIHPATQVVSMFFDPVFSRLPCSLTEEKNTFSWEKVKGCSLEHSLVRECLLFIWWQILSIERQSTKMVSWLNGICILAILWSFFFSRILRFSRMTRLPLTHMSCSDVQTKRCGLRTASERHEEWCLFPSVFPSRMQDELWKWWESLLGKRRALLHRVVLDLRRLSKRYGLCQSFKS